MKKAIQEANRGMRWNHGGPFGAVIVKDGKIIAKGHNMVLRKNDPTLHAEVVAIRRASRKLKTFDLSDCEIYTSCEPCPMCYGAIKWAKIKKVYYGCTRRDASTIGFDDEFIYDLITKAVSSENHVEIQVDRDECIKSFDKWAKKQDKKMY